MICKISLRNLEPATSSLTISYSWASIPGRDEDVIFKLLSRNPGEYSDAPIEGIRQILEMATGETISRGTPLDITPVESIRMGTTVATK